MMKNVNDIKAAIVDCFEDYLEEKNIILPSKDREDAIMGGENPETIAIIYGEDYDIIGDVVEKAFSKEIYSGNKSDKAIYKILDSFLSLVEKYGLKWIVSFTDLLKLGAEVYKILGSTDVDGPMITVRFQFPNENREDTTEYCGKSIFDCVNCFLVGDLGEAEILGIETVYNEDDANYYCLENDSGEKYATSSQINNFNAVITKIKNLSPKEHVVKILPKWFDDVASGKKKFEIRFDDRNYKVDDSLHLCEWERGKFTGREVTKIIDYIYRGDGGDGAYGISEGYVVLGLREPEKKTKKTSMEITIGDEVLITGYVKGKGIVIKEPFLYYPADDLKPAIFKCIVIKSNGCISEQHVEDVFPTGRRFSGFADDYAQL